MAARIPYLQQATLGRARWFDFVFGGWFILVGWILAQIAFALPLPDIARDLGMVLGSPDTTDAMADFMEANPVVALGVLVLIASVVLVPLGYIVSRLTSGIVSKLFGVVGMIGVALSVAGVVMVLPLLAVQAQFDDGSTLAILGASPLAYGLVLFSFVGAILATWGVQRVVHGRTFTSVLTAARRFRWSRVGWVLLLTWGIYAAGSFLSVLMGTELTANPERSRMLPFVVATLLAIPIQCAAEEIMFRGYFNQALGRFIPSALVVFALTSLAFGALHLGNPEVATAREDGNFAVVFFAYCAFGFVMSLMIWIDNGLESAIAVHTANNAWIATVINMEGSVLPIPGLFLQVSDPARDVWLGLAMMVVVLGAVWWTRTPLLTRNPVVVEDALTPMEATA